jgi:hypothetical protein
MEIGTKKRTDKEPQVESFKDDHELLDYLLEQEKLDISTQEPPQRPRTSD